MKTRDDVQDSQNNEHSQGEIAKTYFEERAVSRNKF